MTYILPVITKENVMPILEGTIEIEEVPFDEIKAVTRALIASAIDAGLTPLFIHNACNGLPDTLVNKQMQDALQAFYDSLPESCRDDFVEEAQTETLYDKILSNAEGVITGGFSCAPDPFGNGGWVNVLFCHPADHDEIVSAAIQALAERFPSWRANAEKADRELRRRELRRRELQSKTDKARKRQTNGVTQ